VAPRVSCMEPRDRPTPALRRRALSGGHACHEINVHGFAGLTPALNREAADETEPPHFLLANGLELGGRADDLIHVAASFERSAAVRRDRRWASVRAAARGSPPARRGARWRCSRPTHVAPAAGSVPAAARHPAMFSPSAARGRSARQTRTPAPTVATPWNNAIRSLRFLPPLDEGISPRTTARGSVRCAIQSASAWPSTSSSTSARTLFDSSRP
jgi:hypothetical protein